MALPIQARIEYDMERNVYLVHVTNLDTGSLIPDKGRAFFTREKANLYVALLNDEYEEAD